MQPSHNKRFSRVVHLMAENTEENDTVEKVVKCVSLSVCSIQCPLVWHPYVKQLRWQCSLVSNSSRQAPTAPFCHMLLVTENTVTPLSRWPLDPVSHWSNYRVSMYYEHNIFNSHPLFLSLQNKDLLCLHNFTPNSPHFSLNYVGMCHWEEYRYSLVFIKTDPRIGVVSWRYESRGKHMTACSSTLIIQIFRTLAELFYSEQNQATFLFNISQFKNF